MFNLCCIIVFYNKIQETLTVNVCAVHLNTVQYRYSKYLQLYQFFMLFWVMNFIEALGQVTLAGAFASYYWAFTKPYDVPSHYLSASFYRAIR